MSTLPGFTPAQKLRAKALLATCVAKMMGRKFEEGDWAYIYCQTKEIPDQGWSNLHIDVMHQGLGVEHKMLCIPSGKPLMSLAGTSQMHPSATRSIRIDSTDISANDAMLSVLSQYGELIRQRTQRVQEDSKHKIPDMRTGWLLWERSLTEFMYFEEPMIAPNPKNYWAEWNERPAQGARKSSKNLWIYERGSNKKKYSITTSAGIKIQPYFDVPAPNDPNLYFFRVQSEPVGQSEIRIWITPGTANRLREILNDKNLNSLSQEILRASTTNANTETIIDNANELAVPVIITKNAHDVLTNHWQGMSDEHRVQLFIQSLKN